MPNAPGGTVSRINDPASATDAAIAVRPLATALLRTKRLDIDG
jgi:hypothetical protein